MNNLKFKIGDTVQIRKGVGPRWLLDATYRAGDLATVIDVDTTDDRLPYHVKFISVTQNNTLYIEWMSESALEPAVKPLMKYE